MHRSVFRFTIRSVTRTRRRPTGDPRALTIGQLADRTGLSPAVLRAWESRHGFPVPERSPGGHRWYREDDVALVQRVLRRQQAGVRLDAAVREVTSAATAPRLSVFGALRAQHPELRTQVLHKPMVLALSRAIEDEYLVSAEPGTVCGAFERERFYRASAERWSELGRRSRWSLAFADFSEVREETPGPALVPLGDGAPMRLEWALVAEAPQLSVCLAGWEPPGGFDLPDHQRTFEVIWTVDPRATRTALRVCAEAARAAGVRFAPDLLGALDEEPAAGDADPLMASSLLNRAVAYADRACFP